MVPIKYEIGPATEKFGTRLIVDVHGDVIAEVPMLLNSKMSLDERCAERDRRAHMIVNALNNQDRAITNVRQDFIYPSFSTLRRAGLSTPAIGMTVWTRSFNVARGNEAVRMDLQFG